MFSVRLTPEAGEYDDVIAGLWESGTTGIVEGHGYLDLIAAWAPDFIFAFAGGYLLLRVPT